MSKKLVQWSADGERVELHCPIAMPQASGFLWNRDMLVQLNCRGYATAQHMQPEPGKYSYAPVLEQRTFMQPELSHYKDHPGRFVFIKDEENNDLFSVPYEPVRRKADAFVFSIGKSDIEWRVNHGLIDVSMLLSLPVDDVVELWTVTIKNRGTAPRRLSLYPYFTIGYMSWMNQSARYRSGLGGIVASAVTPYQKLEDYPIIRSLKDLSFLLHDTAADAWETCRDTFEGEGGLHRPDSIREELLGCGDALYEVPAAVLQHRIELDPEESREFRYLFGPANNEAEISTLRDKYFRDNGFESARKDYETFLSNGKGCLWIDTPNDHLDNFVNHWLDRQVFYHGNANRFTTDPQTRNLLQDHMGTVYVDPIVARRTFLLAISQQQADGCMPDGILLREDSELKYINQIPHADHCVWLAVFLQAYFDETGDRALFDKAITGVADGQTLTVFDRVSAAMRWLIGNRDERGLDLIAQGDWCDPMNMVGPRGIGVSGWLSMATVHALKLWADIAQGLDREDVATEMQDAASRITTAIQEYLWDGGWFARGISDDGIAFGVKTDREGRIFLNPQSWSLLAGVADEEQRAALIVAIDEQLDSPYGTMMLAPAYTHMHEHIGRLTQKHPGTAENGSIYNHAAMFYVFALYQLGEGERAFEQLMRALPGPSEDDYKRRGQLPVFVPNYYRGAVQQFPRTAGRSSQLFNTGAASWLYRIVIEGLFGLKGHRGDLKIQPHLPSQWTQVSAKRRFRGADFSVSYRRDSGIEEMRISIDGEVLETAMIRNIQVGRHYAVDVTLPAVTV